MGASLQAIFAPLTQGDGAPGDRVGSAVAISGDTAAIGAPGDSVGDSEYQGSVYVFVREGGLWSLQAKLVAKADTTVVNLGTSVAIFGDTVVAGAPYSSATGTAQGAAYVFIRKGTAWEQEAELLAPDAAAYDEFGTSVAISGETLAVGVPKHAVGGALGRGSVYVFTRLMGVWSLEAQVAPADGTPKDGFGISVSLEKDLLLAGASMDDVVSPDSNEGSAYVFLRTGTTWTQEAKLRASDASNGDYFGFSVSLSGETALIGAYSDDVGLTYNSGSAYVFVRSGTSWNQQAKLTSGNSATDDYFGYSVSLSGDVAAIGSYGRDYGSSISNCGIVYIFVRVGITWTKRSQHYPEKPATNDYLGFSVAASTGTVLAGANYKQVGLRVSQGMAVTYIPSSVGANWLLEATLDTGEGATDEALGYSVSVSGDTAVVGVPGDDSQTTLDSGSAYVFVRDGANWDYQATLVAVDATKADSFGYSVDISGDTVVVGSIYSDVGASSNQGAAYVFVREGDLWTQQAKLVASDGAAGDQFGNDVSIDQDTVAVGAYQDTSGTLQKQGSVYVFHRMGSTWTQQQKLVGLGLSAFATFGNAVALDDDQLAVGAPGQTVGDQESQGAVYCFTRSGTEWTQQAMLLAVGGLSLDQLGWDVALHRGTLLAGAPGRKLGSGFADGAAYVFAQDAGGWYPQDLLAVTTGADPYFGRSVGLSGDVAVVGAMAGIYSASSSGSAYLFVRSEGSWTQAQKLAETSLTPGALFGSSVEAANGYVLIGAPEAAGEGPVGNPGEGRSMLYQLSGLGAGSDCSQGSQCASGFCVTGYCCQSGCLGPCDSGSCDSAGACEPRLCNDANPCTDDLCVASAGGCQYVADDTNGCSDGNACTQTDLCEAGACVGQNPVVCDDVNPCTDDWCNPTSGLCQFANDDTNVCSDGNACTDVDQCLAGTCISSPPRVCDDGYDCTDDICNAITGFCEYYKDDTNACSDGNACTLTDVCKAGVCLGTNPKVCNDDNACTDDSCNIQTGACQFTNNNQNPCSDGNACTLTDLCSAGTCVGSSPKACDDTNPCTDDQCNPATGLCVFVANDANVCSDGNACTQTDLCVSGTCLGSSPKSCDDLQECTDDSCNPSTGMCVFTNDNTNTCSDGNSCTLTDFCNNGVCEGNNLKVCDDGNPCTDDACNSVSGQCQYFKDDTNLCDDGDACTLTDQCQLGSCLGTQPRVCDDDNLCNGLETCAPSTGCLAGLPLDCNDNLAGTLDSCDPEMGCQHTLLGECALDGDCDDGSVCTTDSCTQGTWTCAYSQPMECGDNNLCNGTETCDPDQGCLPGVQLQCSDGNPCTDDLCDASQGCIYQNNDALCNDGNNCTVSDSCSAGTCHSGVPRDCDDQNPCTLEICEPSSGCHYSAPTDTDEDGVCDPVDLCPYVADPEQLDLDQDGLGDACDADRDGDGWPNGQDNCPDVWNPQQFDEDGDGLGDECDQNAEPQPEFDPDVVSSDTASDLAQELADHLVDDLPADIGQELPSDTAADSDQDALTGDENTADTADAADVADALADMSDSAADARDSSADATDQTTDAAGSPDTEADAGDSSDKDLGPISGVDLTSDAINGGDLGGEPTEMIAGKKSATGCATNGEADCEPLGAALLALLALLLCCMRRANPSDGEHR